jgi:hypothetical protein
MAINLNEAKLRSIAQMQEFLRERMGNTRYAAGTLMARDHT